METLVIKTKKVENPFKATKAIVQLGARVVREGNRMSIVKFFDTIGLPTKKNLDTLANKFGIEWGFALDGTLPKEAKSGPNRSFVVVGKTSQGVKVFYDRFQFILFIGNKREKIHNVINMNKKQFEKFTTA